MKRIAFLDHCLPDYFTGYHGPVLSVPTYGRMTNKDIADAISDELHSVGDYINPDDLPEIWELWDSYIAHLMKTPDELFLTADEQDEDDINREGTAYAYFSII